MTIDDEYDNRRWPKRGDKVRYLNRNGYKTQRELANKYLTEGELYTIKNVAVQDFNSQYLLEEFPHNQWFNTVMFEVVDQPNKELENAEWEGVKKGALENAIRGRCHYLLDQLSCLKTTGENEKIAQEIIALLDQFPESLPDDKSDHS